MAHYHVIESTPGYLPDTEPACFTTLRDAQRYAAELARELRDQGYRVSGTAETGYVAEDPDKMADLGRVIEVIPMDGSPCEDAD
ncbi:hypothetical protein TPY_2718 [Sulfobacillus acidophilus TPY]|uniref:Uncharacterized protein n=1 Tax=Sulfobacillus acidophilus (strain ATCC 700253 / DSM 10332 / NAL) TaxID=679936 RepID=G8TUL5_SULAD|nr:hypothetical protein TPY_2718 [Sulfobacillus acidophilus TPY]AEW04662.1 hypothetical protein Sulac_1162 [Sulfobacillus acidophilus DSM 10332]